MTEYVKIRCDDCKFVGECVDYGWQECKKFTPTPSEPMTNEEWLKQCDTEQLAEWLTDIVWWLHPTVPESWKGEKTKKRIREWLKQPHNS